MTLEPAALPVDAVLALDTSYSVRGDKLRDLKDAVRVTLDALVKEDGAVLVTFSNDITVTRASDGEHERLLEVLDEVPGVGSTSLNDGIFVALKLAEEREHPFVVIFTDGDDRFSWLRGSQVLRTAERSEHPSFPSLRTPSRMHHPSISRSSSVSPRRPGASITSRGRRGS